MAINFDIIEVLPINMETIEGEAIAVQICEASPLSFSVDRGAVLGELYDGGYTVTPRAHSEQVLPTHGRLLSEDVTVRQIPRYETSNVSGTTVYIADGV